MELRRVLLTSSASLALACMVAQPIARAQEAPDSVVIGPKSSALVQGLTNPIATQPRLTHDEKLALLRQKIKHVFVLFQENRSFDFYFGSFPGVDGLFDGPRSGKAGFTQPIVNTDGSVGTISPFLIPQTVQDVNGNTVPLYPADTDSVDHSHTGIDNGMDVDSHLQARNDRYALNEEKLTTNSSGQIVSIATGMPFTTPPTLQQKQRGELVMSHIDCDTAPFLWQYADRFALFDSFRQTIIGPSTPNAIAMIAGQSGQTQWALHPSTGSNNTGSPIIVSSGGEPVVSDPGPFPGSNLDTSPVKPPYNPGDSNPATPALNQTYASLPLSFMGKRIDKTIQTDENPALDLLDVQDDIRTIAGDALPPVNWGWYQEGYGHEPTDPKGKTTHSSYIVHHNGPQYFGYVGDNPAVATNLHGLEKFYSDLRNQALPDSGVFYVRGGYDNLDAMKPQDPNPTVQANFVGDDDHPGYSDAQISEALLADEINAIASSPYWKNSAIIITYDETDGLYDHALPQIRSFDPEGNPLTGGPRIPAIVISPYVRVHAIVHQYSEHSSVIRFIDELFNLTPLADLPDEVKGRKLGQSEFGQSDLGPADARVAGMGDLLPAFDNARLSGSSAPLPAEYAIVPAKDVHSLPPYGGNGCYTLNIVPTDYANGKLIDPAPADFNPRPGTTPGLPTSGTWTP
ncbi:MAG TPA: alkaline phosphatase family protein [Acetobacteraceae bacterium]|nr:alkaline phosphatase family protein [Acetobacteraceae bacterium]